MLIRLALFFGISLAYQSCFDIPGTVKDHNGTYFIPLMGQTACDLTLRSATSAQTQTTVKLDFDEEYILANLYQCPPTAIEDYYNFTGCNQTVVSNNETYRFVSAIGTKGAVNQSRAQFFIVNSDDSVQEFSASILYYMETADGSYGEMGLKVGLLALTMLLNFVYLLN